jgi:hypothetical protein
MIINKRQDQIFLLFWIDEMPICLVIPDHRFDVVYIKVNWDSVSMVAWDDRNRSKTYATTYSSKQILPR